MCGITGIVNKKTIVSIQAMMDVIAHRGPDSQGSYEDDKVSFGHLRLAIQDLSPLGHQPMISNDDRYILIMNGEIYNHMEIRNKLTDKYTFRSSGDTETVLYAFAEYGVSLFAMLNGIFAMAIYDKKLQKVYLVRDQFGIKPLYYSFIDNEIVFASEIKSLLVHPKFDYTISETALVNYLYFLYSPGENTAFLNCKKLLSGHYMEVSSVGSFEPKMVKYYEIPFNGEYSDKTEEALIDELDEKLTLAVKRQLLSDVPYGFFLSGGLDSSLIVAIARKLNPDKPLICYTIDTSIGSNKEGFTEDLPYAKLVAKHLKVELQVVKADIDIVKDFDKMIYHLDEPQADAAPLNVMNICSKAREDKVIVLLGGTAGDDLFSGYRRHQAINIYKRLQGIPYFIKKNVYKILNKLPNRIPNIRRAQKLFSLYKEKEKERQFASLYGWMTMDRIKQIFSNPLNFNPIDNMIKSLNNIPREHTMLNKLLYWDLKYFLTDHNLNYTDKMSMAHGVEVRVPFLDIDLVNFSTTIPPDLKLKGNETKYLLKKVAERYLPKEVIYRSKSGFGAPVRDWVTNNLVSTILSAFSRKNILDLFNFKAVEKLINDNKQNKIDASYSIWALLAIHSWNRLFIKNNKTYDK